MAERIVHDERSQRAKDYDDLMAGKIKRMPPRPILADVVEVEAEVKAPKPKAKAKKPPKPKK